MEFIDKSGHPRPSAEVEEALHWVKMRIVKPDFSDPAGIIHCVTIKDALEELLLIRKLIEGQKK